MPPPTGQSICLGIINRAAAGPAKRAKRPAIMTNRQIPSRFHRCFGPIPSIQRNPPRNSADQKYLSENGQSAASGGQCLMHAYWICEKFHPETSRPRGTPSPNTSSLRSMWKMMDPTLATTRSSFINTVVSLKNPPFTLFQWYWSCLKSYLNFGSNLKKPLLHHVAVLEALQFGPYEIPL